MIYAMWGVAAVVVGCREEEPSPAPKVDLNGRHAGKGGPSDRRGRVPGKEGEGKATTEQLL